MFKYKLFRRRHVPHRAVALDDPRPPMPRMRYP